VAKVLIVGCGDLGGEVARQLVKLGIQTTGVKRSEAKIDGVTIIEADVTQPTSLTSITNIHPDIIIYCVAANGQTDAQYKAQYVDGLRHVLATQLENSALKHIFFVSSTRVYGQVHAKNIDKLLDENTPAIATDFGGERLLEAEHLLKTLPCNHTILRLSGIYGTGRLHMINLASSPENWSQKNSWTNRIHRDDAAAFIIFLVMKALDKPLTKPQVLTNFSIQSCYIVTDSRPATQHEVLSWIADKLNIGKPMQVNSAIEGGKRLSNKAMLATGFRLQYPDYQAGYQALLLDDSLTQTHR
jgi:nucleoside-diphosphate-sugar epimerase